MRHDSQSRKLRSVDSSAGVMKLGWSERPGGRFGRFEVVEGFCVRFEVVGGFGNESWVVGESLIFFRGEAECVAK